ncbi:helix-turn-helix domain-containing protein [Rathayibacter agropyri]|uniref:helix-turn-helix domain-containing protein n=1 Tax=Rathayibacter agropyri TaxID=1634927 RepID=UPI0015649AA4|nr:helix-turn-helix domain-containing protein [Rathayibacter agropyri]NRD09270.1 helix-turn-helix domain-containing protein [Rathayibacter agropyri]
MTRTLSVAAPANTHAVQSEAAEVVRNARDEQVSTFTVRVGDRTIELQENVSRFLLGILEQAAEGATFSISAQPDELTSTVAADRVGVSRPTLMKMAREGLLPSVKVGTHTRFKSADVEEFVRVRSEARVTALNELRRIDDELNLG